MAIVFKAINCCLFCICFSAWAAEPVTMKICTDSNAWYPFTYEENGHSKGLHVDIIGLACENVGVQCEFDPLPWKRCLLSVEVGRHDAVASVSYNEERAKYLYYPPGAEKDAKSPWRITQSEYVVITHADNKYEFSGDLTTLPQPVSAPLGYSIIAELKSAGLKVSEYSRNRVMFRVFLETDTGSAVVITPLPEYLKQGGTYAHRVKVHARPITSKSYFLGVSRNSGISLSKKDAIWQAIVDIRQNEELFQQLLQKYQ